MMRAPRLRDAVGTASGASGHLHRERGHRDRSRAPRYLWFIAAAVGCGGSGTVPGDAGPGACATLAAAPDRIEFGPRTVARADTRVVTLSNTGTCATRALTRSIGGAHAGEYAIIASSCDGLVVAPGASCTIAVQFEPASAGDKQAELVVEGAHMPQVIPLTGTGVDFAGWTIFPSAQALPPTPVFTTSATRRFVVTNHSAEATPAIGVTLQGVDASELQIAENTCSPAVLAPGASCHVDVAARPTTTGVKTASVQVTAPVFGTLSGSVSGTGDPGVRSNPNSLDFPITRITTTSGRTITLTNVSSIPALPSITVTGTDAAQYRIWRETCSSAIVPPGGSCTVDVEFKPTGTGLKSAMVHVVDTQLGVLDRPLTGTGVTAGGGTILTTPEMIDFGFTGAGARSTVTVSNVGDVTLGPLSWVLGGTGASSYEIVDDTCTGASLAPSGTCTVVVKPTCTNPSGQRVASLTFSASPGGMASVALTSAISSHGCSAYLSINPTFETFVDQSVGTTGTATRFHVFNSGGAASPFALTPGLGGADPADFTITASTCTGVFLAPGSSCTVDVAFAPQAAGMKSATLTVFTANAALAGNAVP